MKEVNSEKAAYSMIPTIRYSGKDETIETIQRSVVARDSGKGTEE